MSEPIIRFENISKSFGGRPALNNVSLEINKGEIFGIIGMSGSGKTTLLSTLIGFLRPEQGNITFYDEHTQQHYSVFEHLNAIRQIFGFAAQDPSFYSRLTVKENLEYFGKLNNLSNELLNKNIPAIIEMVDLEDSENLSAKELSGGMQKRLDIACSLVHNPKVLILDEPTADLDPILRRQILNLAKKINSIGTTVIIASHFLNDMYNLCDRVCILHEGNVIAIGTPDEIIDNYSKNEEIHLETEKRKYDEIENKIKDMRLEIAKIINKDNKLIIYTSEAETTLHHLLHILEDSHDKLIDVYVNKPSLNEVFEALTEEKEEIHIDET